MHGDEMNDSVEPKNDAEPTSQPQSDLPPAAKRALAEAATRRKVSDALKAKEEHSTAKELGGPQGDEPTRYGDWERGGRAVDF